MTKVSGRNYSLRENMMASNNCGVSSQTFPHGDNSPENILVPSKFTIFCCLKHQDADPKVMLANYF